MLVVESGVLGNQFPSWLCQALCFPCFLPTPAISQNFLEPPSEQKEAHRRRVNLRSAGEFAYLWT